MRGRCCSRLYASALALPNSGSMSRRSPHPHRMKLIRASGRGSASPSDSPYIREGLFRRSQDGQHGSLREEYIERIQLIWRLSEERSAAARDQRGAKWVDRSFRRTRSSDCREEQSLVGNEPGDAGSACSSGARPIRERAHEPQRRADGGWDCCGA